MQYQEHFDFVVAAIQKGLAESPKVFPEVKPARAAEDAELARCIDHTLLKSGATKADYEQLCLEARAWKVWSVCVPSVRVPLVKKLLENSPVQVCTVLGFPFGYASTKAKCAEAKAAVEEGASELDMVVQLGRVKEGDWAGVYLDIHSVCLAAGSALVKVILETGELNFEERVRAAICARLAGARFLKTSTGFGQGGATIEDIRMLRSIAGTVLGVKASGGVRTHEFALELRAAGADRLGCSGTKAVLGLDKAIGGGY